MWEKHLRDHPEFNEKAKSVLKPLFELNSARIGTMLKNSPPARRWLLRDFLPFGNVGAIVAPGGIGKSQLALQLGLCVAIGERFAGTWDVDEPGSVLLLFAEDDTDEIHRRLHNIKTSMTTAFDAVKAKLAESRLYIRSLVGENNLMTDGEPRTGIRATDYVDRLLLVTAQIPDLKLIVIDPASRFRGGEENSAQDTTRFIEQVERIRKGSGATVLVLHHANKWSQVASNQGQSSVRGSSAFVDNVRWLMTLATMSAEQAKSHSITEADRQRYRIASVPKSNYGARGADVVLERGLNGVLWAANLAQRAMNHEQRLVSLIGTEAAAGRGYSATAFENQFGGVKGLFKVGKNHLRKVITGAIQAGYVKKESTQQGTLVMGSVPVP